MNENRSNRLHPLNDFLFKKIFGEEKDKELLIGLLNAILKADIEDLMIEKENLSRDKKEDKLGILDIKAKTKSGQKINIEVQLLNQKNMVQRTLFYWSKLFAEDFEAGNKYISLKKTVTINILDFVMEELNELPFHSTFTLRESSNNKELTPLMELHFIEFPKFAKMDYDISNPLHRWLLFLREDVPEDKLKEVLRMDKTLNKAELKLQELSSDPATRKEYERRAKALSDERSRLSDAEEEGKKEGVITVAKRLLDSGMPLNEVAKFTPYDEEQLKKMLNEHEK